MRNRLRITEFCEWAGQRARLCRGDGEMKALYPLAVAETGYPRVEQPHSPALARIEPAQTTA